MAMLLLFSFVLQIISVEGADACSGFARHKYCYRNPSDKIGDTRIDFTAAECCAYCSSEPSCRSYTHWGIGNCNIFSSKRNKIESGNCTSGERVGMNFVFMFPDTLRAESFSSYGMPLKTTPNLDRFAETGVRFEQAHAMHTQCSPSRATMLTGRYMHVLGHRTQTHLIQPYEFNYFQILKKNGYHIQYYGKNDVFSEDAMNQSVSEWSGDVGIDSGPNAFQYGEAGYYSMLSQGSNSSKDDANHNADYRAVLKATQWMKTEAPDRQPFLLFLPGRGAHPPYGAPREFHDKWTVETVRKNVRLRPPYNAKKPNYHSRERGIPHYRNLTSLPEDTFYKIQATYLGMISYTDWIFGELLRGIREAGFENNTAIFFSSDHGDFGGDFHMIEKWPGGADDVLTRVPVIARIPGAPKARGFVAKAPIQLADIPHTMCELAGINVTGDGSGQYGINFGKSLVRQLRDGVDDDLSRFVYSEGGFGFWNEVFPMGSDHVSDNPRGMYYPRAQEEMSDDGNGSPKWVMRRNLTHKLVYRARGVSELYDYAKDPTELNNVFEDPSYAPIKADMMSGLLQWLVQTGDVTPVHTDPRGVPKYPKEASACATSGVVGPYEMTRTMHDFDGVFTAVNVTNFYTQQPVSSAAWHQQSISYV